MFDGIPLPYDKKKQMAVSATLRVICPKPRRKFALPGALGLQGWLEIPDNDSHHGGEEKGLLPEDLLPEEKQLMRLWEKAEKNIDKYMKVLKAHRLLVWVQ